VTCSFLIPGAFTKGSLIDPTTRRPGPLAPSVALVLRAIVGVRVCNPANGEQNRSFPKEAR
jgi:hypothetical protein